MIRCILGTVLVGAGIWLVVLPLPTGMSGLCLIGFGLLPLAHWLVDRKKWKKGWRIAIWAVGLSVFTGMAVAITLICLGGRSQWPQARQGQYAVVLGAQIWGDAPSLILQQRLDAALVFMQENPQALVIVSGGQGSDEIMTEASVMENYLITHGADAARIFREEAATNTRENLQNAAIVAHDLGVDGKNPVIITSEFHMARAKYIAKSLEMEPGGISSQTRPLQTKINSLVREVFAFVKAWAMAGVS